MSQAKGLTAHEVAEYRRQLYQHIIDRGVTLDTRASVQLTPFALVNTRNTRNVIFSLSLKNDGTTTATDVFLTLTFNRPVEEVSPTGVFTAKRLLNDRRELREAELTGRQPLNPGRTVEVCDLILITNTEADAYGFEVTVTVSVTNEQPLLFRHVFTHDDLDFARTQRIVVEFDSVPAKP